MSVGNRTVILTLSRLANYGLMLISPLVLVRLLSVQEFGQYREFLLYASILQSMAVFSINDSLLYFVPAYPASPWRLARQTVVLTFCSSCLIVGGLALLDMLSSGALAHGYLAPLVAYTLFSVNVDFWEYFWLANRRPGRLFVYSTSRLIVRLTVVVVTAALTRDVMSMIWALVVLEGVRLIAASIAFVILDRSRHEPKLEEPWRDQLRFCVPSGTASMLALWNKSLSSLAVTRVLGPSALAQYAVGRFGDPIVLTLRNSLSSVVLPEMVRRDRHSRESPLALWQKSTAVNAIILLPVAVLVGRYAHPLVTTVFGASYDEAAVVMQIYALAVIRECFDFAPALRAVNRTRPLVESNVAAMVTCAIALAILIPRQGPAGAMIALLVSSIVDVTWLAWRTMQAYDVGLREIVPWNSLGRTAFSAIAAAVVIATPAWIDVFGFAGIILAGFTYLAVFAGLLLLVRVPEALALYGWAKRLVVRRPQAQS
jgi:O-antigen/teichoic acid export membrane protein